MTEIKLTPQELEEIKKDAENEGAFKQRVLGGLKVIEKRFDVHEVESSNFRTKVTQLGTHVNIQWIIIGGVIAYIWFQVRA